MHYSHQLKMLMMYELSNFCWYSFSYQWSGCSLLEFKILQCLSRKQQNQLSAWTIRAVWANDLFTDDSFVVSIHPCAAYVNYNDICPKCLWYSYTDIQSVWCNHLPVIFLECLYYLCHSKTMFDATWGNHQVFQHTKHLSLGFLKQKCLHLHLCFVLFWKRIRLIIY